MLQLKMIFDRDRRSVPEMPEQAPGFVLRTFHPADKPAYFELREICGFDPQRAEEDLAAALANLRSGGFLLMEERASGRLAATAMARKGYYKNFDNLSWVMTHPDYRGRALAKTLCIKALEIASANHAQGMILTTDDFREPALRLYLNLGWRPWIYTEADHMRDRWLAISRRLGDAAAEFNDF